MFDPEYAKKVANDWKRPFRERTRADFTRDLIPCPHCRTLRQHALEQYAAKGNPCVLYFYCPHCQNSGLLPAFEPLQPDMRPGRY